MNILVTGANGQLGTALRAASRGSGDRWIFTDISQLRDIETVSLDITDPEAVRIVCQSERVDLILNCAAYTDVEQAEEDHYGADLLNRQAPGFLAAAAVACGAKMIHISTDYVFRGDRPVPYAEEASPDPTGVYGITKLEGERAILESGCPAMIFRTAWLYSPWGKNFVSKMLKQLTVRPSVRVVYDEVGSPTYAPDLAELLCRIVAERRFEAGVYHYVGAGAVSRYDFARAIRDLAGIETCDVQPCRSAEYPTKARRPAYSVLDTAKVRRVFGGDIPYWRDSLRRCLSELLQ